MAEAEPEVQNEANDASESPEAAPQEAAALEEKRGSVSDSKPQVSPPTEATAEPRQSLTADQRSSLAAEAPSDVDAKVSTTAAPRESSVLAADATAASTPASAAEIPATETAAPADLETEHRASISAKKPDSTPPSRRASVSRKSVDLAKDKSKSQTVDGKQKTDSKQFVESKAEVRSSKDVISLQESKRSIMSLGPRTSKDVSRDMFARRKSSRSIGKAVGSIISFRRGSIAEYFDRQKTAKFMNTFKLDSENPFNVDKVEKILKEVLIEALDNLTYDPDKVPKQAKWASSVIRAKVKEQEYDRYKLICIVTIGEKRSQDVYAAYRFLWDTERDKHACYIHENMYVFAIAMCFGIYYE